MDNIFCIDLEDWFHQSLIPSGNFDRNSRVERNTESLLELFEQTDTKATFFCLGQIAQTHPGLIKKIQRQGHEIACHGYDHKIITQQTADSFREDVSKAKALLEDVCGVRVKGYRAPSWTITNETLWALEVLQSLGFSYDSSIYPVKNFLYGIPDAPVFANQITVNNQPFWEIPPSTFSFMGKNMGFSGGFYFRVFPKFMIKYLTGRINKKLHPAVFYLHPVEIDKDCPRIQTNLRDRLILYWGILGCEKKLSGILKSYRFVSIESFFNFK